MTPRKRNHRRQRPVSPVGQHGRAVFPLCDLFVSLSWLPRLGPTFTEVELVTA